MLDSVTVIIPHIAPRQFELTRAVSSVAAQSRQPNELIVAFDGDHEGSAATRNRVLQHVTTRWVAFLDDDDELFPNHLELLLGYALREGATAVYPGCRVVDAEGTTLPQQEEWGRFGKPFDGDLLRKQSYIPVTSLVNTSLAKQALFGPPACSPTSDYDDWGFYLRLLDVGARFTHVPEVTWVWHHHGKNTSGRGDRW